MIYFVFIFSLISAVAIGYLAAAVSYNIVIVLALVVTAGLVAFFSPRWSLALLVFSMLLSPELGMSGVGGSRTLVIRYDDILLVSIFLAWFARTALFKDKPFITATPVQTPVLLYTLLCVASTAFGIMRGDINPRVSVFYVLKYVEYFLLYFMTVNIVQSKEEIKKYLRYGLVVAVLVTFYAYHHYYSSGADARASAPFETPLGEKISGSEPASLGGYYLLVFGIILAMMTEYSGFVFVLAAASMCFMFPAFLLTFSRASYIGFMFLVPVLITVSRRRKILLASFFCIGLAAISLAPGIPAMVKNRITMTFAGEYAASVVELGLAGQVKLEDSAAARVYTLKRVIYEKLPKHPILGWGVTGVGLCDTQYALALGELGLAGFFVFLWMLYRIFSTAGKVYRAYKEPWIRALALGLMASIAGLLLQATGVNNFIIVRIMEPFWFLTALVMALHCGIGQEVKPETLRNV